MATVPKTAPSNKNGPSAIVPTMIDDAQRRQSRRILFAETSAFSKVPKEISGFLQEWTTTSCRLRFHRIEVTYFGSSQEA